MPKVLTFGRYVLYFWVGENDEPVHVHVAVRRPTEHSTKFWLTRDGGCLLAANESGIPQRDLRDIAKLIVLNHGYILDRWVEVFGEESVRYFR